MRNVPPGFGVGIFGPRLVLVGRFGRYGLLGGSMSPGTGWEGKSLVPPPISSAPLAGEDVSSSPCSRHMACHSLLCLPALTASYPSGMGTKTHPSFHERLLSQCFIRATEKYPSTQGVTVPPQGRLTSVSCTQIAYLSDYCPMIKINNIYL